ncbi:MAG: CCA tRNA nucleotidyltransferase [Verrucomicrobiae bacterium]|nr:CCA tRNA nucleotidyltransferase [Verrucomicrobiae bacterium]
MSLASARRTAEQIAARLRAAGHEALLAGGCVRDALLRRRPKDYDVATSATPPEVERLFPRTVAVGKAFGVVRVREEGFEIEVATFRVDGPYLDGRRPSTVRFCGAEEDARRRDFTINGLFFDPARRRIVDYVGGRRDLARRLIRAIGDPRARFREDHLRMLRAVRFAAELGFRVESETWRALEAMAPRIRRVSAERLREEMTKLLLSPRPGFGLKLLAKSGLLRQVLPEVNAMRGVSQPRAFHPEGDVLTHTAAALDRLPRRPSAALAWGTLLHDVGKPPTFEKSTRKGKRRIRFPEHARVGAEMAEGILRRLRFSNADREAVVALVANHMTFKDVPRMRLSTVKRLLARPSIEEELALHRADCLASHGSLANVGLLRRWQRRIAAAEIRPPRWVTGHDLLACGLAPGPRVGRILAEIEEAQLEGKLKTREEALRLARRLAGGAKPKGE